MMVVIGEPMPDPPDLDTRTRMIVSATELFREHGYSGTGFRDVVAHSGAPRGSIYHHFPGGKTELAEEAVRLAGDVVAGRIERAAADGDPQALVDAFADGWRRQLRAQRLPRRVPRRRGRGRGGRRPRRRRRRRGGVRARGRRCWRQALRRAGVPRARAGRIATLAISAIEGAVIQCRVARTTAPLDDVRREIGALIDSARRPVASAP